VKILLQVVRFVCCGTKDRREKSGVFRCAVLGACILIGSAAYGVPDSCSVQQPPKLDVKADIVKGGLDGTWFTADKNVRATYKAMVLTADHINGNPSTGDIFASGHVIFRSKDREIKGETLKYNFNTDTGQMADASGVDKGIYFKGKQLIIEPTMYKAQNSKLTGCNAPVPHYYLAARTLDIHPGKEMIAHHVSVYLYGHKIVTWPRYVVNLRPQKEPSKPLIPPFSSSSKYGQTIGKEFDLSNGTKTLGVFDIGLSTREIIRAGLSFDRIDGFPVFARAAYRLPVYEGTKTGLLLSKAPEIGMRYLYGPDAQKLATTRRSLSTASEAESTVEVLAPGRSGKVNMAAEVGAGYFIQDPGGISSTRYEGRFLAWLSPVPLGSRTSFSPGVSARVSQYGTGQSYGVLGAELTVGRRFNEKMSLEFSYQTNKIGGSTPFAFDAVELAEELDARLKLSSGGYTLGFRPRYNVRTGTMYDLDYSLSKMFHCVEPNITFSTRFNEITVGVTLAGM